MRLLILDSVDAATLLALKAGGFFDGAELRVPTPVVTAPAPTAMPVQVVERAVPVPVVPAMVAPEVISEPPPELTPQQAALLAAARQELAEYRAEKGAGVPQAAQPPADSGTDTTPAPIVAPEALGAGAAAQPAVAQLAACTKLRDVLQLLLDSGLPAGEIEPYLESVKSELPLLQRISNLAERVSRTLEVMGRSV